MTGLPEPPVPSDIDLRDFRRMPFDVLALDNSAFDLTTDDDEFRAGFRLWCRAWHQVPAGSLPDDDRQLCQLAGLGRHIDEWQRIKEKAMHGFVLCADGRWYHTFLCEIVKESWKRKNKTVQRRAGTAERVRRHREAQKRKGEEGNGAAGRSTTPPSPRKPAEPEKTPHAPSLLDGLPEAVPDPVPDAVNAKFEEWWALYPRFRRGSKGPALKKWTSILRRRAATADQLIDAVKRYRAAGYDDTCPSACGAAVWLNQERWTIDSFPAPVDGGRATAQGARGMAAPAPRDAFRHTDDYTQELDKRTKDWGVKT